ncbi:TetR/AcrR family transcriptional regulator [Brevibacillus fluminis]|uniref:TetR/AcrR family transcriptional regulator n=2 Tax=Brevibacillus fluminis TaxID=511487 RepID=A0A3M8DAU0_9BACL|nr:TetR/AcrR family transcriptional regulator [Brevibacillus fluminis]
MGDHMTKDKIKHEAMCLFAQNGYNGTALAEIAKQVGIKTPSIFAHFKGKEDLFLSVFADLSWQEVSHVEQIIENIEEATVEEKLSLIFHETCRFYLQNEVRAEFLKRTMLFPPDFLQDKIRERFITSEESLSQILREIFVAGIEAGVVRKEKTESLIAAYYCTIDGVFLQMSYYGKDAMTQRLEAAWKNFWLGITNKQAQID